MRSVSAPCYCSFGPFRFTTFWRLLAEDSDGKNQLSTRVSRWLAGWPHPKYFRIRLKRRCVCFPMGRVYESPRPSNASWRHSLFHRFYLRGGNLRCFVVRPCLGSSLCRAPDCLPPPGLLLLSCLPDFF